MEAKPELRHEAVAICVAPEYRLAGSCVDGYALLSLSLSQRS
jgi:hypothetical protein